MMALLDCLKPSIKNEGMIWWNMAQEIFDLPKKATLDLLTKLTSNFSNYSLEVMPDKELMSILVSYRDESGLSREDIEEFLEKNEYPPVA